MIKIFILLSILLPSLWGQSYTIPPGSSSGANVPSYVCIPASASTTTYTCSPSPAASAYTSGMVISFKPDVTNTGSSTVNVNSLGAKTIQKLVGGTLTNVAAGDLDSDVPYLLTYNGTVFVLGSIPPEWSDFSSDLASQAEAEAGSDNTKWMSPLRTAQAISALGVVTAGPSGALTVSSGNIIDVDTAFLCLKTGTCAPSGSQDFSGASTTKSMKTGTATPGTCSVGEFFFDTDATAGQNIYACTDVDEWTLQGGGGTSTVVAIASGTVASSASYCTGAVATVATVTIPANTLEVGDLLEVFATFTHSGASTWAPTLALGNSGALPSCCISENNNGTATIAARWHVAGTTDTRFSGVIERANGSMTALGYLGADTTSSIASDMDLLLRVNCTSTESMSIRGYSVRVTKF